MQSTQPSGIPQNVEKLIQELKIEKEMRMKAEEKAIILEKRLKEMEIKITKISNEISNERDARIQAEEEITRLLAEGKDRRRDLRSEVKELLLDLLPQLVESLHRRTLLNGNTPEVTTYARALAPQNQPGATLQQNLKKNHNTNTGKFQQKNKKNLRVNVNSHHSSTIKEADSVGIASSLIPFGRTPEVGTTEEIPPNSRSGIRNQAQRTVNSELLRVRDGPQLKRKTPPGIESYAEHGISSDPPFTRDIRGRKRRSIQKQETSVLIIPKEKNVKAYEVIKRISDIPQRWIQFHLEYHSGAVLLSCTSADKIAKIRKILKDNSEIEVKKYAAKEYKVRIHNIRLDYPKDEIKLDVEERFKMVPMKIDLIPYKKFNDKGLFFPLRPYNPKSGGGNLFSCCNYWLLLLLLLLN